MFSCERFPQLLKLADRLTYKQKFHRFGTQNKDDWKNNQTGLPDFFSGL